MAAEFKHVMLMVKNVKATVKFYSEGLGLEVKMVSPGWAELDANGTTIAMHAASESDTGSSPILSFHVDDVHAVVSSLEALGASMEGEIREPSFGKVAAMRSPDGHLLSLLQPAKEPAAAGSGH
ncbi:VOC family protein [cf. Phormidesmis sp. LEGE 11477]|uniref:VOC family protein n=1 Tax=cf. Phormidesmis sp. LEGE 11477 TaxID=1828680 RepID=UPI00187EB194|nr:VOC family protein [cf. Phormidesmis sp. LEGE 11477]MBE9061122.1 VOC family protein [cf. Phormidesmis sp. LEGE 11477]